MRFEDYTFTVLGELINGLKNLDRPGDMVALLRALATAVENLRLSLIEPDECAALRSEATAWATDFAPTNRLHLLRVLATLGRARRLAESYTERIQRLFPPRADAIGRALGVAAHAIKLFSEGDIRGHLVFQLSRLVDLGLQATRQALRLPPWEAIVPGETSGLLVHAAALTEFEGKAGPFVALLDQVDGEAEIPVGVKGIVLGHTLPHLSHLGVPRPAGTRAFRRRLGQQSPQGLSTPRRQTSAAAGDARWSPCRGDRARHAAAPAGCFGRRRLARSRKRY